MWLALHCILGFGPIQKSTISRFYVKAFEIATHLIN